MTAKEALNKLNVEIGTKYKVTTDTGYIDDLFNNSDVKKWLKTGK